jgi:hypothetical protein
LLSDAFPDLRRPRRDPLVAGFSGKTLAVGVLGFAIAGAAAGAFVVVLLLDHQLGGSPSAVVFGYAIPAVLPWLLGGLIVKLSLRTMHA